VPLEPLVDVVRHFRVVQIVVHLMVPLRVDPQHLAVRALTRLIAASDSVPQRTVASPCTIGSVLSQIYVMNVDGGKLKRITGP